MKPSQSRTRPPAPEKKRFYLLDDRAKSLVVDGRERIVDDAMRNDGVELTEEAARFYLANGTLGTERASPETQAAVAQVGQGQPQPRIEPPKRPEPPKRAEPPKV